jgi:hypothetical protein
MKDTSLVFTPAAAKKLRRHCLDQIYAGAAAKTERELTAKLNALKLWQVLESREPRRISYMLRVGNQLIAVNGIN